MCVFLIFYIGKCFKSEMFVFMSLLLLTALLSCSSSKPICSKTRKEIAERTGLNPNGDFTKMLKALMGSDFVVKYAPFGFSQREEYYKLIDSFCWFWLHFKEKKAVNQTPPYVCGKFRTGE